MKNRKIKLNKGEDLKDVINAMKEYGLKYKD